LPKKIFNHLKRKLSLSHESSPGDFISQRSVSFVLSAVMPITAENLRLAIETSVLQNDLQNTDRRLLRGLPSATRLCILRSISAQVTPGVIRITDPPHRFPHYCRNAFSLALVIRR
jgi:hypothetical protein